MKNLILVFFALSISISITCSNNNRIEISEEKEWTVYVSPFKPLLLIDDHVSEGFLTPLEDGRILLLLRFDPGIEGCHVGTDGYIAKISYDPGKDEWGEVETVYNSHQYDDRNVHGGITNDGRIVLFFRRYIPEGRITEGRYFIYSEDDGQTWSEPQISEAWTDAQDTNIQANWSTGQMFYNPDIEKYSMLGCRGHITYSHDGTEWEEYNLITEKQVDTLGEIAGAWCGDNRVIALIRDVTREYGHPLMQVESYDNGQTWTDPVQSNVPPKKHWGAAPQIYFDQKRDLLIAMNSDRYSRPDEENSLFIYTARPDEVFGNPEGWTLQHELLRPWAALNFDEDRPLNQNFYGYPTIAPISEDEYLVVFTERARMHGTEQADLYYFRFIVK